MDTDIYAQFLRSMWYTATFGHSEINFDGCVCVIRTTDSTRGCKLYEIPFTLIVMHITCNLLVCLLPWPHTHTPIKVNFKVTRCGYLPYSKKKTQYLYRKIKPHVSILYRHTESSIQEQTDFL